MLFIVPSSFICSQFFVDLSIKVKQLRRGFLRERRHLSDFFCSSSSPYKTLSVQFFQIMILDCELFYSFCVAKFFVHCRIFFSVTVGDFLTLRVAVIPELQDFHFLQNAKHHQFSLDCIFIPSFCNISCKSATNKKQLAVER